MIPRWVRIVFFAGFPLAFAAGIALEMRNEDRLAHLLPHATIDREHAIASAREFLAGQGVDVRGWTAFCGSYADSALYRYLAAPPEPLPADATRTAVPATIRVLFQSADKRRAGVTLSLEDRVIGYDLLAAGLSSTDPDTGEADALQIAQAALEADPDSRAPFRRARPDVSTIERAADSVTRKFTWHAPLYHRRELEAEASISVRNHRVLAESRKVTLDPVYARRQQGADRAIEWFGYVLVLFMFAVSMYSIGSYARRAAQKEVSHSRTAWMAALFALLFFCVQFTGRDETVLQNPTMPPVAFVWGIIGLMVTAAGILVGIAYSSGEGDVREAFPGKLTSLDALVLGHPFSSNVGGSVVIGAAFAGWLVLLRAGMLSFLPARITGLQFNTFKFAFLHTPWLSALAAQPAFTIIFAAAGLLQPLAFLTRHVRRPRLRRACLIVCTLIVVSGSALFQSTLAGFAVVAVVGVAALLLPFFLYDFLAAVTCLIAIDFGAGMARLAALLPEWTTFAVTFGVLGAATVAIELIAWRRGRLYREDEVRPEYARHIAERLALKAELAAAREAQLRLLPQSAPPVAGLSISAFCLPAREVGGDFYDFFPLGDQRLGIFLAEGAGRGLASALAIALAKGYLMHAARPDRSPGEVVRRLEKTLGSILHASETRADLAYAVIDARAGTLTYARTGAYPRILVSRGGRVASQLEGDMAGSEHDVREGAARLDEGDSIVLFTDGVARRLTARSPLSEEEWIGSLAGEPDAESLRSRMLATLGAKSGSAPAELEDDLTAVVVRREQAGAGAEAMEVVA